MTHRDPSNRTLVIDYGAKRFENQNLLLFMLFKAQFEATGEPVIRGVSFHNCQIDGPAVLLAAGGCNFSDTNFGMAEGDTRTLVLHPGSPMRVTGAIPMIDCEFDGVDFFGIGFTGSKVFIDDILGVPTEERP